MKRAIKKYELIINKNKNKTIRWFFNLEYNSEKNGEKKNSKLNIKNSRSTKFDIFPNNLLIAGFESDSV